MITLSAEVLCDQCGKVCGVGEPTAAFKSFLSGWAESAIALAEAKAGSHGAQINVASVTCAECLAKERIRPKLTKPDGTQDARFLPKLKSTTT